MEQKKILWVILSVSLFVLIIFGAALALYSPSSNSLAVGGEIIPYESPTAARIDPDVWARDPNKVSALDKDAPAASGNIINLNNNVNIISSDGQSGQQNGIDVSDLTTHAGDSDVSGLPKELAEQIGIDSAPAESESTSTPKKDGAAAHVESKVEAPVQVQQPKNRIKKDSSYSNTVAQPKKQRTKKAVAPKVQTVYWVQTASLANRINAERARDTLAAQHMKVEIFTKESTSGLTHRVRVGPFSNNTEAHYWLNNIKAVKGFEKSYVTEETVAIKG